MFYLFFSVTLYCPGTVFLAGLIYLEETVGLSRLEVFKDELLLLTGESLLNDLGCLISLISFYSDRMRESIYSISLFMI